MSSSARTLARVAVPPILALGLAGLMVRPMPPVVVTDSSATPVTQVDRTAALRSLPGTGGPASASIPATDVLSRVVAVTVPPVAFTERIAAVDGRLRTPVLLTDPSVTAAVSAGAGCSVSLVQGVVGWLDCPVSRATTVEVQLSDGRVFTHPVAGA